MEMVTLKDAVKDFVPHTEGAKRNLEQLINSDYYVLLKSKDLNLYELGASRDDLWASISAPRWHGDLILNKKDAVRFLLQYG